MRKFLRKNAVKTPRGRPFKPGNPGRPRGALNKATLAAQSVLDGEAGRLARKAVERALEGDTQALRLCLERLVAPRRERPVCFKLPPIHNAADMACATAELIAAASRGEILPSEAESFVRLIEVHAKMIVVHDFEQRLTKLEQEQGQ